MTTATETKTEHLLLDARVIRNRKGWLAQAGEPRLLLADTACPGLRLTLFGASETGTWSYTCRRRGLDADGKRHPKQTVRLGDLATMTPTEARVEAEAIKAAIRAGRDPVGEMRKAKEAQRLASVRAVSCADAAAVYSKRRGNGTTHLRNENGQLKLALADMKVERTACDALMAADLRRLLDKHQGHPARARARLGAVSRFLDDCVEREIVGVNVARTLSRRALPPKPTPRKRVYSAAEVQALWKTREALGETRGDFLRFMLLSPLRRQEASGLCTGDFDASRNVVVIDGAQTKNGDTFTLPLAPSAREIAERRASGKQCSFSRDAPLFPLQANGKAMASWKRYAQAIRQASGVADFNFHDLRRTFMSTMAEHDAASIDVLDALLNHRQSATVAGVRAAYLHARLAPQKAVAMANWGKIVVHAVAHGVWPMDMERAGNTVALHRRSRGSEWPAS
jgi:integrase